MLPILSRFLVGVVFCENGQERPFVERGWETHEHDWECAGDESEQISR